MTDDEKDNGKVTYYYSREARLERASQAIKDLNDPSKRPKGGFFRVLFATRGSRFLLFSIVVMCGAFFFISRYFAFRPRILGNNAVTISVVGAGEKSFFTIKKTVREASGRNLNVEIYTGTVDITVTLPETDNLIWFEKIIFNSEKEEVFTFEAPFREKKLLVLMEAGGEQIRFMANPK